ncbi:PTS glucose transporter subunit IIA [Arthrobacter sp. Soil736]|uniref:PTS sugar transporter subunit IIA n=1 Tax=Arthrobacter sp. Soil736 TaxID=1736395 RepID=UPI0006FED1A8|nr:PTS glucose transporter subunit IIA [Arthrobacter sp. Soil736]KRE49520.1 PTS glucose transporter subunit IIA [Arthrobacter sp. Soil736]
MPQTLIVRAPIAGTTVPIGEVPDPVFSAQMVGSGAAVEPPAGQAFEVVSPVAGKIIKLLPHAFVVVDAGGRGVLTHIGIDTVKLQGVGFELLAEKGATVSAGAPIMRVDPAAAVAAGYSLVSPVVVLDTKPDTATPIASGEVEAGAELFSVP